MIVKPKITIKLFLSINLKKSKTRLYIPLSSMAGFDATEIKGMITETAIVSIIDNNKVRTKRIIRKILCRLVNN
jgi:hypothetical protein